MKKLLLLTLSIFVATAVSASATTCASAPLSTYDVSGFTCTLGDLTFSGFAYNLTNFGGATGPSDGDVNVTPVTTGFGSDIGFEFSSTDWTVTPGEVEHSNISFAIASSNPAGITDLLLQMAGGFTGDGSASVTEDTSTPPSEGLFTEVASGTNIPTDSVTFAPVGSLTVSKEVELIGGSGASSAQVSQVFNLFSEGSAVPEPSLTFLCLGALAFVPIARRKFIR